MKQEEKDIELIELFTGDPELANKIVWGEEYIKPLLREVMTRIMNLEQRTTMTIAGKNRVEGAGTG